MGLVSRRTIRVTAFLLATAPIAAGSVLLSGTATAYPAQTKDGEVTTTADFKFVPPSLTVPAGAKVTWTNTDGAFHTVTGGENGVKDEASPMDGTIAAKDAKYSVTFPKAGTYKYYCAPHAGAGMVGEIVVTGSGGGTAGTASPSKGTDGQSAAPSASASASASVGAPQPGAGAPTAEPGEHEEDLAPGIVGNPTLARIEEERAAHHGAVSGFRFFTMVAAAFLVILGTAVLFSTRPRRAGK